MADWKRAAKKKLSPKLSINIQATGGLGRYTGNGGTSEPVGVVHGQEYVVSEPIVRALGGPKNVEKMLASNLQGLGVRGFKNSGSPSRDRQDRSATFWSQPTEPTGLGGKQVKTEYTRGFSPNPTQTTSFGENLPSQTTSFGENLVAPPPQTTSLVAPPPQTTSFSDNLVTAPPSQTTEAPVTAPPQIPEPLPPPPGLPTDVEKPTSEEQPTSQYENYLRQGLGGLSAYAAGRSPVDRKIFNATMGYMQASNEAERSARAQELAQMGLSPNAAAGMLGLLGRQHRSEESQLAGNLAGQAGNRAYQAAGQLGSIGLGASQFEEGRRQFDENMAFRKESNMASDAAAGMTWGTFSEKYPDASYEDWQRMQTGFEQGVTMGEQQITSNTIANLQAELNLETAQMDDITSMINSNAPFDVVNARFREYTGRDMTPAEYQNLQKATSFGQTQFTRQMNLADTLISIGGPDNLAQAGQIYSEEFPGINIDWSKIIIAENTEKFNSAMKQLTSILATAGNDFESAVDLLASSGTTAAFDELGIDHVALSKLYQSLATNKIDEEWDAISTSSAYKTLVQDDPEFAQELKVIWARNKLGVENMEIYDRYNVLDAAGNVVATVAGEEAANAKAEEIGGTVVKTGKKTFIMTDNETGTKYGGDVDIPDGAKQGDVWVYNGIAYEFDTELGATPTTWADPFDRVADKLYALGPEDNPYYDDIVDARAGAYLAGDVRLNPGDLGYDDPVYKRILNAPTIPKGVGASAIDKKHHYFTTFQPKKGSIEIPTGTLLNLDDKLWSYAGPEVFEDSGDIWYATRYWLIDMATGERYFVQASEVGGKGGRYKTVKTPKKPKK